MQKDRLLVISLKVFKYTCRCVQKANVGNNRRDKMPTTLHFYRMVVLRGILMMNIFPHSLAPLKLVEHIHQIASKCNIYLPCF